MAATLLGFGLQLALRDAGLNLPELLRHVRRPSRRDPLRVRAQPLQNLPRAHVHELHLHLRVELFIARYEILEQVLPVRGVDEQHAAPRVAPGLAAERDEDERNEGEPEAQAQEFEKHLFD